MTAIYPYVFVLHIACAAVSFLYFLLRGYWMLADSTILYQNVNKIAPHIIDTILLSSAVILTLIIEQYPIANSWLTIKLIFLLLYIILGSIALKRGKTKTQRAIAFIAALCTFSFIVSVAYFHHPMGVFY